MIDWDDAFDNMGHIDGAQDYPPRWAAEAQAFREAHAAQATLDLSYGPHPREAYDLFRPAGQPKGLMVFVHGGYWLRLDKSFWSQMAAGGLAQGWAVAVPSYPLAPEARISEITTSITRAIVEIATQVDGQIRLVGHSAGGHLVTRMMCDGVLPDPVAIRLARVTSISGLHALESLRATKMNESLRLTEEEASTESPANLTPMTDVPLTAWVGAQERPEFLRQTRLIEDEWTRKGADVTAHYAPGLHHFTVIEALRDGESDLMAEVLR